MMISNEKIDSHEWLNDMYEDDFFPDFLVDKVRGILLDVCQKIEKKKPTNLYDLYIITHTAVAEINKLQDEFYDNNSEIETVARDTIGTDFDLIAKTYGFVDVDTEELIANRDW